MAEEFRVDKSNNPQPANNERKVIDEANYRIHAPRQNGPSAIGRGGDPLFMNIRASKDQLQELLDETTTVQDWVQRETCNNVAISCLNDANLKEIYYEIKDGFQNGDEVYGPLILMGFKTPQGVEIPRLKMLDSEGEVVGVLSGDMAIAELNKRAQAFKASSSAYETLDLPEEQGAGVIEDYSGNPEDYS